MFQEFPKMARLTRDCVITEKIDGTNAQIEIVAASSAPGATPVTIDMGQFVIAANAELGLLLFAGSRTRYITPADDNFGFAKWVQANTDALWSLGEGRHYGEWWGQGIQRGYGLTEKRFSLFNTGRWADSRDPLGLVLSRCARALSRAVRSQTRRQLSRQAPRRGFAGGARLHEPRGRRGVPYRRVGDVQEDDREGREAEERRGRARTSRTDRDGRVDPVQEKRPAVERWPNQR